MRVRGDRERQQLKGRELDPMPSTSLIRDQEVRSDQTSNHHVLNKNRGGLSAPTRDARLFPFNSLGFPLPFLTSLSLSPDLPNTR